MASRPRDIAYWRIPVLTADVGGAIVGLGSLRSVGELKLWHAAGLSDRLPAYSYHVANELRADAATHLVLGWLMGAYRMTRYRSVRRSARRALLWLCRRKRISPTRKLLPPALHSRAI